MQRFSYGANPVTSLIRSLMNLTLLLATPLRLDGFGFWTFFVTLWPFFRPTAISAGAIIDAGLFITPNNMPEINRCREPH